MDWQFFDPLKHQLDVYMPLRKDGVAPSHLFPVIFYVHGGAFMFGDRTQFKPREIGKCLAKSGYVTVIISYRLSHVSQNDVGEVAALLTFIFSMIMFSNKDLEKRLWLLIGILTILIFLYMELQLGPRRNCHPCHIQDCALAYAWTANHIHQYHGNIQKTILMGHSAGGHLVSLLASHPEYLEYHQIPKKWIKGIVAISGVYSDTRLAESRLGLKLGRTIFGRRRKYWRDAFPINHIYADQPPILLLSAEFEGGLKVFSYDYYLALMNAGCDVSQHCFTGLNHFNIVAFWMAENRKILYIIEEFIHRVL